MAAGRIGGHSWCSRALLSPPDADQRHCQGDHHPQSRQGNHCELGRVRGVAAGRIRCLMGVRRRQCGRSLPRLLLRRPRLDLFPWEHCSARPRTVGPEAGVPGVSRVRPGPARQNREEEFGNDQRRFLREQRERPCARLCRRLAPWRLCPVHVPVSRIRAHVCRRRPFHRLIGEIRVASATEKLREPSDSSRAGGPFFWEVDSGRQRSRRR